MSELVRVVNKSRDPITIHYPDEGVDLEWTPHGTPGCVYDIPLKAAQYAQSKAGDHLEILSPGVKDLTVPREAEREYWIANVSGDPDAWEKKPVDIWDRNANGGRGGWAKTFVENGNRVPTSFTGIVGRTTGIRKGWVTYINGQPQTNKDPNFQQAVTVPGRAINIPAYSRVKVSRGEFEVLIQRDAEQSVEYAGRIIPSRAPSDFEPSFENEYWTIDKARLWLKMTPDLNGRKLTDAELGPTEAELEALHATSPALTKAQAFHKARFDLIGRCVIRAMRPTITLPSKKDFEMALAREAKAAAKKA